MHTDCGDSGTHIRTSGHPFDEISLFSLNPARLLSDLCHSHGKKGTIREDSRLPAKRRRTRNDVQLCVASVSSERTS